jgi:hypothetical protein
MEWRHICQSMDYLDCCAGNRSSALVILISIWAWIKPFTPINSIQGTKDEILIVVLAQHIHVHVEHVEPTNRSMKISRTASSLDVCFQKCGIVLLHWVLLKVFKIVGYVEFQS